MKIILTVLSATLLLVSCSNYGKKVKKGSVEVYYKEGIAETEASRTAQVLSDVDKAENNNTEQTKSVQLIKVKDTVVFRMVADKAKAAEIGDFPFQAIGTIISDSVFKGKPVLVELTDNTLTTYKKIPYLKLDLGGGAAQ
ncbi:MAG: hypothetical protein U0V75_11825 [Ferruginibacter sp.]